MAEQVLEEKKDKRKNVTDRVGEDDVDCAIVVKETSLRPVETPRRDALQPVARCAIDSFSPDWLDTVSRPYTKGDTDTTSFADFLGEDDDDVRSMGYSTSLPWDTPFDSDSTDRLGTVSRPDTERDTDTAALLDSLGPDIDDAELCVCPSLASDTPVDSRLLLRLQQTDLQKDDGIFDHRGYALGFQSKEMALFAYKESETEWTGNRFVDAKVSYPHTPTTAVAMSTAAASATAGAATTVTSATAVTKNLYPKIETAFGGEEVEFDFIPLTVLPSKPCEPSSRAIDTSRGQCSRNRPPGVLTPIASSSWQSSTVFTTAGGRFQLQNSDVILDVPSGAVNNDDSGVTIFRSVCADVERISHFVRLKEGEHVVSPMAEFSATGRKFRFEKPVTIILPTCLPADCDISSVRVCCVTRKPTRTAVTHLQNKSSLTPKGRKEELTDGTFEVTLEGLVRVTTVHFSSYVCLYCGRNKGQRSLKIIVCGSNIAKRNGGQIAKVSTHVWDKRLSMKDFSQENGIKESEKIAETTLTFSVNRQRKCAQGGSLHMRLEPVGSEGGSWRHCPRDDGQPATFVEQICALNQLLACEKPTCKAHDNCSPHRFDWMLETRPTSQGLARDDISLECVVDVCFVPYRKNPPWTDCRKTTNLPFQIEPITPRTAKGKPRSLNTATSSASGEWSKEFIKSKVFYQLCKTLGHDWQHLVYSLPGWAGTDRAHVVVEQAQQNDPHAVSNQIRSCLVEWSKECPESVNKDSVLKVLRDLDLNSIADDLANLSVD